MGHVFSIKHICVLCGSTVPRSSQSFVSCQIRPLTDLHASPPKSAAPFRIRSKGKSCRPTLSWTTASLWTTATCTSSRPLVLSSLLSGTTASSCPRTTRTGQMTFRPRPWPPRHSHLRPPSQQQLLPPHVPTVPLPSQHGEPTPGEEEAAIPSEHEEEEPAQGHLETHQFAHAHPQRKHLPALGRGPHQSHETVAGGGRVGDA